MGKRKTKPEKKHGSQAGKSRGERPHSYEWNPFPNIGDDDRWKPPQPRSDHDPTEDVEVLLQRMAKTRTMLRGFRPDRSQRPLKRSGRRMQGNR